MRNCIDLAIVDLFDNSTVCMVRADGNDTPASVLQAAKEFCRAHCAFDCDVIDSTYAVVWKHR